MSTQPSESEMKRFVLFNTIIISLILLKSAGFIYPYYVLSVHGILLVGAILAVVLLGAKSKHLFLSAVALWVFTYMLATIGVSVWPETIGMYVYDILAIATLTAMLEKKE